MVELSIGDHVISPRSLYSHHGIYIGGDRLIHYSGKSIPGVAGIVEEICLIEFTGGQGYSVKARPDRRYAPAASVERARSRLGEAHYCEYSNNCEHFVEWCIIGSHDSGQVDDYTITGTGVATAIGVGGGVGTVSAVGTVAGLSGSGIMSGLASAGALGGGAVGGLAAVAAAPGLVTSLLVSKTVLRDNPALGEDERNARKMGRIGTGVGAVAGTAGGIAAVSAAGTTAGLSAAGITSGLAAIGGGTMVGGVAVAVAAPAVAAAAIGVGLYKAVKWFRK